jgi:hypothetical protein
MAAGFLIFGDARTAAALLGCENLEDALQLQVQVQVQLQLQLPDHLHVVLAMTGGTGFVVEEKGQKTETIIN